MHNTIKLNVIYCMRLYVSHANKEIKAWPTDTYQAVCCYSSYVCLYIINTLLHRGTRSLVSTDIQNSSIWGLFQTTPMLLELKLIDSTRSIFILYNRVYMMFFHRKKETFICNRPYGPWTKLLYTIHNEIHGHVTMVNYLNWN